MWLATLATLSLAQDQMLPVGKKISPEGTHAVVGSYPLNMVLTQNKKFAVVTHSGFRQELSVLNTFTGAVTGRFDYKNSGNNPKDDGLYYGMAVHPQTGDVYVSRGAQDMVSSYHVDGSGQISEVGTLIKNPAPKKRDLPYHFAGLAFNSNGSRLLVVNNQTARVTDFKGSATVYETASGKPLFTIPTNGFPLACAYLTQGKRADAIAYVASERDGCVDVLDLRSQKLLRSIPTGTQPVGLKLNRSQSTLYVANSGSDTISVINTATDKVTGTIMVRPPVLRGVPGAGPLEIALSNDEQTAYVTLSDMDAVAVIDLKKKVLTGYVPTGWLPTGIAQSDGHLLVASAKGTQAMNPNGKPVGDKGTYIQDIIGGTVTHMLLPTNLKKSTAKVIANNRLRPGLNSAKIPEFNNPGIKHVIYIIKENRTYDNVLGDIEKGNGDKSICLFPKEVSPNQHALAERFVLLDNFYCCAEVSQDGWQWSISGMTSAYGSRNTPYNYSGRGRSYDTEGQNSGEPVELFGINNVAKPAGGYIWEQAAKAGVSFRNYGMYTQFVGTKDKRNTLYKDAKDSFPDVPVLVGKTNTNFRHYDNSYADSPIYDEYGFTYKGKLAKYGAYGSTNRFSEWKREFDSFVKKGSMPGLMTVRFCNDHTVGTSAGKPTPQSMVAENDYAVGKVVEAVSHSPFWNTTAICVLEDDAQAGMDHVDAHRSTAYVISPYIKKGTLDSRFYNTDSMLRTIGLLLGMKPMNQYDAVASPIAVFGSNLVNAEPFTAIKPSRDIVCRVNDKKAYRSQWSDRISQYSEESDVDEELNEVLWHAIKGPNVPMPRRR